MIGIFSQKTTPGIQQPGWEDCPDIFEFLNFDQPVTFYCDIDNYCVSDHSIKIAFYQVRYSKPRDQELSTIDTVSRSSNVVFLFHNEVYEHDFINHSTELFENAYWIIPGACAYSKQKIITWQYHIWRIAKLYQNKLNHKLKDLRPYEQKQYFFSALLGGPKKHRQFVQQEVLLNNLQNKIICKMLPQDVNCNPVQLDQSTNWWLEPEISTLPDQLFSGSGHFCQYYNITLPVSCIMPVTAYNTCAYSILAETGYTNHYHMPTEKSAKLFLGQQLFVAFAGAGFLQHLRDSGYKTFDNIIDESYDQIEDDHARWSLAFKQVIDLCNRNQSEVLEQAQPILQHNFSHATDVDMSDLLSKIQQALSEKEINCTTRNLTTSPYHV